LLNAAKVNILVIETKKNQKSFSKTKTSGQQHQNWAKLRLILHFKKSYRVLKTQQDTQALLIPNS